MRRDRKNMRQRGFLLADFLTAIVLLGLMVTVLTVSMGGFSKFNSYQWARQRCMAAATAQLDSITATGSAIDEPELQRLWPHVNVVVARSAADGPWAGLELVQVTAAAKETKVRLARYIPLRPAVAKGGQP
jgi:type II secretory pathway pseudopilin PulG